MIKGREEFAAASAVSRETLERLDIYVDLLSRWNRKINLVAPSTVDAAWTRHIKDSAQILQISPGWVESWVDLGSGGGFPGAVVAIVAADKGRRTKFSLVESDQRKATFLRTVARETGVQFIVHSRRIEDVEPLNADVVSARALAPLDKLLGFVHRHMNPSGVALLPKGANWQVEYGSALEQWTFDCKTHASTTDADAVILEIGEIKRV